MHAINKISLRICPIAFYCGIIIAGHTGFDAEVGAHDDLICAICIPLIIGEWQFQVPPEYDSDDSIDLYRDVPGMGVYSGPY